MNLRTSEAKARVLVKRNCKSCGEEYIKYRSFEKWCPDCAVKVALAKVAKQKAKTARERAKVERAEIKVRKEKLKTINDWIADAQVAFNAYIRARDEAAGYPCICCGRFGGTWSRGGIWDCGHFRSRGSAGHLRFDERNAHRQLKQCNSYGAGRHADYRVGLIARIGIEAVEALEADQTLHKWTIEELKDIKAQYKAKLKILLANCEAQIPAV